MIPYDVSFQPPAPVLPVTLISPTSRRRRRTVPALVDSGSDVTAVPRSIVEALQLYPVRLFRLEALDQPSALVAAYSVQVQALRDKPVRVEVVPSDLEFVVLGRDVLNALTIRLDGPNLLFTIE